MIKLEDTYYVSLNHMLLSERSHRISPYEWSDGKVDWGFKTWPCVQKSLLTGKYVAIEDFEKELGDRYDSSLLQDLSVAELADAFAEIPECAVDSKIRIRLLWCIVHKFNDKYRRNPNSPEPTLRELNCFVNAAMAMQRYSPKSVPPSVKAELFRELGLFRHAVAVFAATPYRAENKEENEIMDEVVLRALRGDSSLFVIEHRRFIKEDEKPIFQ